MVGERSFFASFHPSLRTDSLPAGKSGRLSFSYESKKRKETKPPKFGATGYPCFLMKLLLSYRSSVVT